MPLIGQKDADYLRKEFSDKLVEPMQLVMFTQEFECQYCRETRQLVEEVGALSDKIDVQIYNLVSTKKKQRNTT